MGAVCMYGAECWTLRKDYKKKILATEMGWLRKILRGFRIQRIRNEEIRKRIGQNETICDKIQK